MRVAVSTGRHIWLAVALVAASPAVAQLQKAGTAPARGPDAPKPDKAKPDKAKPHKAKPDAAEPGSAAGAADPQGNAPIVPESEFDAALPPLSGDINAPLELIAGVSPGATSARPAIATPVGDTLPGAAAEDPQLAQPLDAADWVRYDSRSLPRRT